MFIVFFSCQPACQPCVQKSKHWWRKRIKNLCSVYSGVLFVYLLPKFSIFNWCWDKTSPAANHVSLIYLLFISLVRCSHCAFFLCQNKPRKNRQKIKIIIYWKLIGSFCCLLCGEVVPRVQVIVSLSLSHFLLFLPLSLSLVTFDSLASKQSVSHSHSCTCTSRQYAAKKKNLLQRHFMP